MTPTTTPAAEELREALKLAAHHIDRMSRWMANTGSKYDFSDLKEDHKTIQAALSREAQAPNLPVPVKEIDALYEEASTGKPWDNLHGTIRVQVDDDLCCPIFESRTPAELGEGKSYDARFADAWRQEQVNAKLVVALVNAWPALRQLHGGAWSGWQDISSAPKDGTAIDLLMYRTKRPTPEWIRYASVWWEGDRWYHWFGSMCEACDFFGEEPQFWMPVPEVPDAPTPPSEGE